MFHVKHSGDLDAALARLREQAGSVGLALSQEQLARFERAARWLAEMAQASALSGYQTPAEALGRAMAPALAYFALPGAPRAGRLADLGAGSGALGATLAILAPELRVDLIDRARRAYTACELLAARLHIGNLGVRLLDLAAEPAPVGEYDAVVFRALAPGPAALGLAQRLLTPGCFVAAWHREGDPQFAAPPPEFSVTGSTTARVEGLVATGYQFRPQ